MNFAARLAALIERRGLTQRSIALECEVSPGALTQYLQGRIPKSEELYRLARFFDVSMEYLLTGEEPKSASSGENRSVAEWKERAKTAERKVEMLKAGAESLVTSFHSLLKKI